MITYLLPPLVQTVFSLILIFFVLKAGFRNLTQLLFSLYLFGLALWGIVIFNMRASPDVDQAFSWERWLMVITPLISVLLYHFSVRYGSFKIKNWLLPAFYFICFACIPLATTEIVLSGMQIKPYGYAPIFGPGFAVWILFNYALFVMALLNFVKKWRTSLFAEERNRAAYIVVGIFASLVGALFDILPVLGLPLYPGLVIGNIIFCTLTTVSIKKHHLLDIRIFIRKTHAY